MSYRPGYSFRVASTVFIDEDGKRKERRPTLYDKPWDHAVPPDKQSRCAVAELEDQELVEVTEYTNGAVKVVTTEGMEGWLG